MYESTLRHRGGLELVASLASRLSEQSDEFDDPILLVSCYAVKLFASYKLDCKKLDENTDMKSHFLKLREWKEKNVSVLCDGLRANRSHIAIEGQHELRERSHYLQDHLPYK